MLAAKNQTRGFFLHCVFQEIMSWWKLNVVQTFPLCCFTLTFAQYSQLNVIRNVNDADTFF